MPVSQAERDRILRLAQSLTPTRRPKHPPTTVSLWDHLPTQDQHRESERKVDEAYRKRHSLKGW
jgi:hypothetical protein